MQGPAREGEPWLPDLCRLPRLATLFGVAVGGQAGAAHALDLLEQELRRVLGLVGTPKLADLERGKLLALRSALAE